MGHHAKSAELIPRVCFGAGRVTGRINGEGLQRVDLSRRMKFGRMTVFGAQASSGTEPAMRQLTTQSGLRA